MMKFHLAHPNISTKIIISSLIGIVFFLSGFLIFIFPKIADYAIAERRYFLKEKTVSVLHLFQQYQDDVDSGLLSPEEARKRAMRRVRGMTYSRGDYYWIMDTGRPYPVMIMHPMFPENEGKIQDMPIYNQDTVIRDRHDAPPKRVARTNLLVAMVDSCLESGNGYVAYRWPKPAEAAAPDPALYPKESYVALFKPWGWIIGTGEYVDDLEQSIATLRNITFAALGVVSLLAVGMALLMAASITKPLRRVVGATKAIAQGDLAVRSEITTASDELEQLSANFDHMARVLQKREQERQAALVSLEANERKFRTIIEHTRELFSLISPDGHVIQANPSSLSAIGARFQDVAGKLFWETPWWNDDPQKQLQLKHALERARDHGIACFETYHINPLGRRIHIDFSLQSVTADSGEILLFIAEGRDISERHEMESRLRHMALHDPLTGLANRTLLQDRISQAILWSHREPQWLYAILFVDIDRFKVINDSLGHSVGDEILKVVAGRFKAVLREGDTLARYGGDEFVALVRGFGKAREAVRLARRLMKSLAQPIAVAGAGVSLQASVGIELNPPLHCAPDELIRNANLAMHHAKHRHRSPKVFTRRLLEDIKSIQVMEQELPAALENGQIHLLYQPICDVGNNAAVLGFEALCRWLHPEHGHIPPPSFIRMAEETGLICRLGEWVLDEACRTLSLWNQTIPGSKDVFVSVNVSPRQLGNVGFTATVLRTLKRHGINPGQLHLEITETAIMDSSAQVIDQLHELVRHGVHLSIDDFGSGYSNLALLIRLPVSDLKIDLSIVMDLDQKPANRAVIRTIVTMAKALDLNVVTEGVETELQRDMLVALGCSIQQGYLHARPLRQDAARSLLAGQLERRSVA